MSSSVKRTPKLASTDLRVSEVAELWAIVDRLVDLEDYPYVDPAGAIEVQEYNTEYNRLFDFVQSVRTREVLELNEFQTLMTQIDSNIGTDGGAVPRTPKLYFDSF